MDQPNKAALIAALNDRFRTQRRCHDIPGYWVATQGIANLAPDQLIDVHRKVAAYDRFDEDSDPHGEHDFGAFDADGVGKVFWKIDYYAPDLEHGSEDPADTARTVRVLTVMLASEY